MKSPDNDILEQLFRRFADPTGGRIEIMATPEQLEQLGEFLLKGVLGWALGIYQDECPPERLSESSDETAERPN